jgi:rod shape-determining protein MreD
VSPAVGIRVALIVFVGAILQVSAFSSVTIGGSGPDVLLVTLVSVALLRGAVTGAVSGFFAGLIVDVATLGTLGLTALLLTLAGYWAGRYGETTGRSRRHAPILAALAATVFVGLGGYVIRSMLGESISPSAVLLALPSALIWNALLIYPTFALTRRIVGAPERVERPREVELLV